VLEAYENGPVIIKIDMHYKGTKNLKTNAFFSYENRRLDVELMRIPTWKQRQLRDPGLVFHSILRKSVSSETINPGWHFSKVYYLHHDYSHIPEGQTTIYFRVKIYAPYQDPLPTASTKEKPGASRNNRFLIAMPQSKVNIFVKKATDGQLEQMKTEIERELLNDAVQPQNGPAFEKLMACSNRLSWIEREDFANIALKVLASPLAQYENGTAFRPYIYYWSVRSESVRKQLVKYLCRSGTRDDTIFIENWAEDKVPIPAEEIKQLHDANNLWIKASSYYLIPFEDRPQLDHLFKEVDQLREYLKRVEDGKPPP
jgi:hypothetical protein